MSTPEPTARRKAVALLLVACVLAGIIAFGLLLREYGPGNMGTGFLQGAAFGIVVAAVMGWRAIRKPDRATTFERAFTQMGDERDDAVLTRSLAVLGLAAVPTTGVAAIAIGLGAYDAMVMCLLLFAQIGIGAVAFAYIARRS